MLHACLHPQPLTHHQGERGHIFLRHAHQRLPEDAYSKISAGGAPPPRGHGNACTGLPVGLNNEGSQPLEGQLIQ
eukprot:12849379-Alexandrium_andersonii.AAC.1